MSIRYVVSHRSVETNANAYWSQVCYGSSLGLGAWCDSIQNWDIPSWELRPAIVAVSHVAVGEPRFCIAARHVLDQRRVGVTEKAFNDWLSVAML
jgi:hypothetical protein